MSVTCQSATEARAAIDAALRILSELSVQLHAQKTRVVHVRHRFEFLGYLVRRGRQLQLPPSKIVAAAKSGGLYTYPREKSVQRFRDRMRQLTRRCVPLKTKDLPKRKLYGEYGLVQLVKLIPSIASLEQRAFVKAWRGKTAHHV